ncbi:MAG: MFS transporter [Actinobacteria bacterium]|nr:MFS transporter [Actinomycetota bacterium]
MTLNKARLPNIFYISFVLYGISSSVISPLIPVLSVTVKTGFNNIGLVLSVASIFSLLLTFASGRLCDKFNLKIIMMTGIFLIFLGFLLSGVRFNFIIFTLFIILINSGYGLINPLTHTYVSKLFHKNHSSTFLKMDFFWYLGAIIAPLAISAILFFNFNYRYLFIFFAAAFFIMLVSFFKVNFKRDYGYTGSDENCNEDMVKFSIIRDPILMFAGLMMFFYQGALSGMLTWLTTYFTAFNLDVATGSVVLSFYWVFALIGIFLTVRLLKKSNEITMLLFGSILGIACNLVFVLTNLIYIKFIFILLQAMFFSVIFPLTLSLMVYESHSRSGTILGFNIAAAISGSILFQPLLGYIAQFIGRGSTIYVILAGLILGLAFNLVLFLLLRKKYKTRLMIKL